jgi:hypothetical protein
VNNNTYVFYTIDIFLTHFCFAIGLISEGQGHSKKYSKKLRSCWNWVLFTSGQENLICVYPVYKNVKFVQLKWTYFTLVYFFSSLWFSNNPTSWSHFEYSTKTSQYIPSQFVHVYFLIHTKPIKSAIYNKKTDSKCIQRVIASSSNSIDKLDNICTHILRSHERKCSIEMPLVAPSMKSQLLTLNAHL